jgi:site-specific DNA recombinase
MFERYAAGESLRELGKSMRELGLRSKKGKQVANSMLARMLQNPIYTGDFEWGGKYYHGKHEPLVSRELFDRVQEKFEDKSKPRAKKRSFAFRGLLKCGVCGCVITAEEKKGRYVYYGCTHSRGNCSQKRIREERLAEILGEPLKRVRVSEERLEWIVKALRKSHEDQKTFNRSEVKRLEAETAEVDRKIDALYEDKLAGVVPVEFWERKYREFSMQRGRLKDLISEHDNAKSNYLEDGIRILELAQDAYRLYIWRKPSEQRKILDMILSNPKLKDGKIETELNELFKVLADGAEREEEMRAENASKTAIDEIWLPG